MGKEAKWVGDEGLACFLGAVASVFFVTKDTREHKRKRTSLVHDEHSTPMPPLRRPTSTLQNVRTPTDYAFFRLPARSDSDIVRAVDPHTHPRLQVAFHDATAANERAADDLDTLSGREALLERVAGELRRAWRVLVARAVEARLLRAGSAAARSRCRSPPCASHLSLRPT